MSSHRTPSSATHVAHLSAAENTLSEDAVDDKSSFSYVLPTQPLRPVNPTVISAATDDALPSPWSPSPPVEEPQPALRLDPRRSEYIQRWKSMTMESLQSGFVNVEPRAVDGMSIGRYTADGTVETFPYDRTPNLQKLCKGTSSTKMSYLLGTNLNSIQVFYRLYSKQR